MAAKGITTILAGYFNEKGAPNYVNLTAFAAELKKLSPEEKLELALGVCAITGDTIKTD